MNCLFFISIVYMEESWFSGRVSDHGSEGRGFESRRHRDWTLCLSQTTQWTGVLVHPGSKHQERLSVSSENLFRNRCKINKLK